MTVPVSVRRAGPYACDGVETDFDFAFKVFTTADAAVILTDGDGVETVLVLNSDYTVVLNGDQESNPGGTITTIGGSSPYATGNTITMIGALTYKQGTNITNLGGFLPSVIMGALDYLAILIQQLKELTDRSLRLPASSSGASTELPVPEASTFIGWNALGTALVNYVGLANAAVSSVMEAFVGSATKAAARAELGVVGPGDFTAAGQILIGQAAGDAVLVSHPLGGAQIINGKIALSVGSSALTIALKGLDGADPSATNPVFVRVPQLTSNVFDGTYAIRKVTAALSLVISSGSTLAGGSGVASAVHIGVIDNAGTLELVASKQRIPTPSVITTTAEGGAGAADGTGGYSTTARANVPYCAIGRWKSTQTTAGTWASVTGEFQLYPYPVKAPKVTTYLAAASSTHAYDWDSLWAEITVLGGGGGGGGAAATGASQVAIAGPGAAGAWGRKTFNVTQTGTQGSYTVGAAGAAGSAGANNGGTGGTSSWADGINSITATGGVGGLGAPTTSVQIPSLGGTCSGGTLNVPGNTGTLGMVPSTTVVVGSARGGDSILGPGGRSNYGNSVTGIAGLGNGSGGGGAANGESQSAAAGGAGTAGAVVVVEHYQ